MQDGHGDVDRQRFAYAKIQLLRGLADNRSERQIADDSGIAYATARWHIAQLKALTGCHDVGELARWWSLRFRGQREPAAAGGLVVRLDRIGVRGRHEAGFVLAHRDQR